MSRPSRLGQLIASFAPVLGSSRCIELNFVQRDRRLLLYRILAITYLFDLNLIDSKEVLSAWLVAWSGASQI